MVKRLNPSAIKGWCRTSDPESGYITGLTDEFCHSGNRCAFVKSTAKTRNGIGCISQQLNAKPYLAKRLRFSAFIKSKVLKGGANVWLRGFADDHTTTGWYCTSIDDDHDWKEYEVFLEVPSHSVVVNFGLLLDGKGTVWIDDAQLEVVDTASRTSTYPTPIIAEQYQNLQPINLNFVDGTYEFIDDAKRVWPSVPTGWTTKGWTDKQNIDVSKAAKADGGRIARITSTGKESMQFELKQFLKADHFIDKQVRFSAALKSSKLGWATLWTTTYTRDGKPSRHNLSDLTSPIKGTTDWQLYECPIPVASNSDLLSLAIVCVGRGRLWIKNVKVEVESYDPAEDEMLNREDEHLLLQVPYPTNLDFRETSDDAQSSHSQTPAGWVGCHEEYQITACQDVDDSGSPGVVIETLVETPGQYSSALLSQYLAPEKYLGKRLRFSAQIKSSEVDWAAVWLRARRKGRYVYTVGFKNLHRYPITGSTDWSRHNCVVDVPEDCIEIRYGVVVHGPGRVWVSQAMLEEVSQDVPTNDVKVIPPEVQAPQNLNFEDG